MTQCVKATLEMKNGGPRVDWAHQAKLEIKMPQRTEGTEADGVQLPSGVLLKPPVTLEDLKADTEYDPKGAEELVALIRELRNERSRPLAL